MNWQEGGEEKVDEDDEEKSRGDEWQRARRPASAAAGGRRATQKIWSWPDWRRLLKRIRSSSSPPKLSGLSELEISVPVGSVLQAAPGNGVGQGKDSQAFERPHIE
eukprot:3333239-Pyramimonas_sp.AAC.1